MKQSPIRAHTHHVHNLPQAQDKSTTVELATVPAPDRDEPDADDRDYFKSEHGMKFAGTHLILDVWDADRLDDLPHIEEAMKECVEEAGATLLHIHLHHFEPNGGVTGVAVLSESHISIHSWPERRYAALDVFMCGDAQPHKAIAVLQRAFGPDCRITVAEHKRGLITAA